MTEDGDSSADVPLSGSHKYIVRAKFAPRHTGRALPYFDVEE